MPSTLTWLDHDYSARERSLRILSLFKEKESRDELGIGGIRDALADRLFPGTSTIQTRLRYMLLVPWVYQRLELQHVRASQFAARARQDELSLVTPLIDQREQGVFGSQSGSTLKRLPSSVYWSGLGAWGIRRFIGSQQDYHRSVDKLYQRRALNHAGADDSRDPDDRHADLLSQSWHPRMPEPPVGFPQAVDLRVTKAEAEFLVDRITATCGDSLLGWLVVHGQPADVLEPWLHPQIVEFPMEIQELLRHGRLFADLVEGGARVYNLCLAELAGNDEWVVEHRDALADWAGRIDLSGLHSWSPDEFWSHTDGFGHTITYATRRFVETLLDRVRDGPATIADDFVCRSLVRDREKSLKGPRSRFVNRGALTQWSGSSGTGRLVYRWPTARSFLSDLYGATDHAQS